MDQKEQELCIRDAMNSIHVSLDDQQVGQLQKYYEMTVEKNQVMNLTAITEFHDFVIRHFLDSLLFSDRILEKFTRKDLSVIDVGTGAGFPGIPLKIAYPALKVTLLDSLNKRLLFLNDVISAIGLENTSTVHYRAEDGARDRLLREKYDLAVSRAVANMSTLAEYCIPYVKPGGLFVAYKSDSSEEELKKSEKVIEMLGGKVEEVLTGTISGTDINRNIILIRKVRNTSNRYPRKAGIPSREPLS